MAVEIPIDKWTGKVFSKLDKAGSADQDEAVRQAAAQALLGGPSIWDEPCGKRLRAFAACLALPEAWHRLALDDIRDAYTVVRRKGVNPNATLLQSDERAMTKLSDAGDYLPLYFGIPKS